MPFVVVLLFGLPMVLGAMLGWTPLLILFMISIIIMTAVLMVIGQNLFGRDGGDGTRREPIVRQRATIDAPSTPQWATIASERVQRVTRGQGWECAEQIERTVRQNSQYLEPRTPTRAELRRGR